MLRRVLQCRLPASRHTLTASWTHSGGSSSAPLASCSKAQASISVTLPGAQCLARGRKELRRPGQRPNHKTHMAPSRRRRPNGRRSEPKCHCARGMREHPQRRHDRCCNLKSKTVQVQCEAESSATRFKPQVVSQVESQVDYKPTRSIMRNQLTSNTSASPSHCKHNSVQRQHCMTIKRNAAAGLVWLRGPFRTQLSVLYGRSG